MRIVLLGPPGSGKGTQAARLVTALGLPHISTGALLRAAVAAGTDLGRAARAVMDRGELVSDDVMLGLIEQRLAQADVAAGFILDGFPRTLAQAGALDVLLERLGQPLGDALLIEVDTDEVVERLAGRAAAEGRSDDSEAVVRRRLEVYAAQTAPVVDHYAASGLLTRILGAGSVDAVHDRIIAALRARGTRLPPA